MSRTFPQHRHLRKGRLPQPGHYWPELHGITGGTLRDEWFYFAHCVREETRPQVITPDDGKGAVRTSPAAYESAAIGAMVTFD